MQHYVILSRVLLFLLNFNYFENLTSVIYFVKTDNWSNDENFTRRIVNIEDSKNILKFESLKISVRSQLFSKWHRKKDEKLAEKGDGRERE